MFSSRLQLTFLVLGLITLLLLIVGNKGAALTHSLQWNAASVELACGRISGDASRIEKARESFEQLQSPRCSICRAPYLPLGQIALWAGEGERTESLLCSALVEEPKSWMVRARLGFYYAVENRFEEATEVSKGFVPPSYFVSAGLKLCEPGEAQKVTRLFDFARLLGPISASEFDAMGHCYEELDLLDQAIEVYRASVAKKPDDTRYYYDLGLALSHGSTAQREEAVRVLREGLEISPWLPAYIRLGESLLEGQEAHEVWLEAWEKYPNHPTAPMYLAGWALKNKDWEQARQYLEAARRVGPNYGPTHFLLGRLFRKQPNPDLPAAIREFEMAVELRPSVIPWREVLWHALIDAGRCDEAAVQLESMRQLAPQSDLVLRWQRELANRCEQK